MGMKKNTAGKWTVFAFTTADNLPKTGDAAQITANIYIDGGAANAVDDTNPTEVALGFYTFDVTAAETNGSQLLIVPDSSTAGVEVIGVPGAVWTDDSGAAGAGLTAIPWNVAWDAEVQSECDDAITANTDINDILTDTATIDTAGEIAAAVWGADATTYQTQGTFGQAIGDPVSDANTIYKAVVSDATGVTVGVDVVALKAETAAILTDTGTTLETHLTNLEAAVITNAAGVDIAADIIAVKAVVDDVLTDTAVIGALGAGLTALATQASVDAIDAYVDTEVGAIKTVTDNIAGMYETDGAVKRFTANALELGPTGTGGDATLANQTKIIQILTGKWEIANNQLLIYDSDKTTVLYTLDLTNTAGTPSSVRVTKRVPV